jgi:hypothetical protein
MPKKKMWMRVPEKKPKPKVPPQEKQVIEQRCNELIDTEFKPKIVPPPQEYEWNYVVDIFGKWYRNYLYFCCLYNCPGKNAITPQLESRFTRLE